MTSKLCSIIVPIYNAAPFLAQCLSSIRMQTYKDLQVILVDDGSTDESAEIAKSFVEADNRFVLVQQPNQGQSVARNVGTKKADGEYLVFVDADDYIDSDFVEQHLNALGTADYVQSGYRRVCINGDVLEQKLPIHRYQFVSPCMRLYRRDYLVSHHLEFPEGMIYEDAVFSPLLWDTKPSIQMIKYVGYNYSINPTSTTSKHSPVAQRNVLNKVRSLNTSWWIKLLTLLRLKSHFSNSIPPKIGNFIGLILYVLINSLFVVKYSTSLCPSAWLMTLGYWGMLAIGGYLTYLLLKRTQHLSRWLWGLGALSILTGLVLQYVIDPYTLHVDRWSAIHNWIAAFLSGDYPYSAHTHLGGYGSPFPVWQIVHIPFYAMGNVALSTFVIVILWIFTMVRTQSVRSSFIGLVALVMAPAFWFEVGVRSDLMVNMLLVATICQWLIFKRIRLEDHAITLGILAGAVLSTRLAAVIPLAVLYGYEFLQVNWRKQLVFVGTVALTFALVFLPFICWPGSTILSFQYSPFVLQTRQGSPLIFVIWVTIAIASVIYFKPRSSSSYCFSAILLFILASLGCILQLRIHSVEQILAESQYDITYFSIAVPFIIMHYVYSKHIQFTYKCFESADAEPEESTHLHIVAFDIPYPPTYGGAIDVYYRIKALHEKGVNIILHCTYKGELMHYKELEKLCKKVYYYPRHWSVFHICSRLPLSVHSRDNASILQNLIQDDTPILYEGLVSCGTMSAPELQNRKKYFRECNIEHDYYNALADVTPSLWEKWYYRIEARRLKQFEAILNNAQGIFALAHQDEAHFIDQFPRIPTYYLPCFHSNQSVTSPTGLGQGVFYHGNLNVAENHYAAEYIIKHIAPKLPDIPFIIAGRWDGDTMSTYSNNVHFVFNPSEERINQLLHQAQVHLLLTFQATGLKLKLLNALYNGRHVVTNSLMVHGTELAELCYVASDEQQLVPLCQQLFMQPFTTQDKTLRAEKLQPFNNTHLIQSLIHDMAFNSIPYYHEPY